MFCDLVGSTPLSQRLDPEDLRRVVRAYQDVSSEIVTRYEGYLAQYLGDGLLVYFGYPLAHEEDAERAVRVSLAIVAELPVLSARLEREIPGLRNHALQVRIGIHTGLVVAGEMGRGDRSDPLAIGETPNIAARIQGFAPPNTVVISGDTHRLVAQVFDCVALGAHELKGVTGTVPIYRVFGDTSTAAQREEAPGLSRTPLVGRDQELGLLLDRWEMAKESLGQVVILTGEAGIGKSRLLRGLKEAVDAPAEWRLYGRCSPYHRHSPLHPLIDLLERAMKFQRDDSAEDKIGRIERALGPYQIALGEVIPFLAALLTVDPPDRYPAPRLSPEQQKRKTLEAFLGVLLAMAGRHPLLLTLEDLHWMDPSTLELIDLLIDQAPTARLLLVMTARPSFDPPWSPRSHLTHLTLNRFTKRHTEQIVANISGQKALPAEVLDHLVAKTDGVPLFVEELTKFVLESGLLRDRGDRYELTGPLPPLAIPSTLQDSLMARLDRLAPIKEVAQLGATFGRAFSYELLRATSTLDDATLEASLAQLVAAEMIYQRGLGVHASYVFKHALIQETAYQSLLKSTRQQYHQRIAHVLTAQFPETAETQPELLAHHYTEAGAVEQAIEYWKRAGTRSITRSSHLEAVAQYTRGLDLMTALPMSRARTEWELEFHAGLGPALIATRGQSSAEALQNYRRARELCEELGDAPQLFPVLVGLRMFYTVRGELTTARSVASQLLGLAESIGDRSLLVEAHYAFANVSLWLGEIVAARDHVEAGMAHHEVGAQPSLTRSPYYVTDPVVSSLSYGSWALWALGHPSQAMEWSRQAVQLAEALSHPHSLATALDFAIALHEFRREGTLAKELAEKAIRLCTEHGFPFWMSLATIRRGWALAELGDAEGGIEEMQRGLSAWQATGAQLARPFLLGLLADAYGKADRHHDGLLVLGEAMAAARERGEEFFLAELYRLSGELRLKNGEGEVDEAEELFRLARGVAQSQGARSFELRAVMSMCRVRIQQGQLDDARDSLADIYGSFSEGFDSGDLRDARQLLQQMGWAEPG